MGPRIGLLCRNNANRVVIACVDGRRLHGHVYNFSMAKDTFRLFPEEDSAEHEGIEVFFKDLKAVFFVKDFAGDPERHDLLQMKLSGHGPASRSHFSGWRENHRNQRGIQRRTNRILSFPLRSSRKQYSHFRS